MTERTSQDEKALAALPVHIRARLDEFNQDLENVLGSELVGVILHGSVARGEYRVGESGVDAIVVIVDPSFEKLEAIGDTLQRARYAARIEAIIVTEDEIAGASDVFPLFYDEIKQRHILLSGRDPFATVDVHDTYRRLRIEQELRETQLRLRRAVTDALGAREAIGGAVNRKVRQVRGTFHALLALKGIPVAPDLAAVLAKIGETYGVDLSPVQRASDEPQAAHVALTSVLAKAIQDVNKMAG